MASPLPADEIQMEQAIVVAIRDTLLTVPIIADYVNLQMRERYPSSDEEDIQISTIDDFVVGNRVKRTSLIEFGIPTVEELEYTGDKCTQLNFTYPITFSLEVVDSWDVNDSTFRNSTDLFKAVYLKGRRALKNNRTLGYDNCVHQYLQQENAGTVEDEETGGRLHIGDWALTVNVTGVLV